MEGSEIRRRELIGIRDAFLTFVEMKFSKEVGKNPGSDGSGSKALASMLRIFSQIDKLGLYSTGSRILLRSPNKKRNLGVSSTRKVRFC